MSCKLRRIFDGFDAVADLLQSVFLDNKNDKSHSLIVDKTTTTTQKTQKGDYSFDGSISRLKREKIEFFVGICFKCKLVLLSLKENSNLKYTAFKAFNDIYNIYNQIRRIVNSH